MTEPILPTSRFAAWAVLGLILGIFLLTVFFAQDRTAGTHDDWRRTARGWERTTAWPTVAPDAPPKRLHSISKSPHSTQRLDTHPAVLALLQLIGVLAALLGFRSHSGNGSKDWKSILAQSFRASAFGS